MKIVTAIFFIIAIVLLTILTQVGGIILIICLPIFTFIDNRTDNKHIVPLIKLVSFIAMYLLSSFTLVPWLASGFGRIPLPVIRNIQQPLQPLNMFTVLLNRHYVQPVLKTTITNIATELNQKHTGLVVCYLDANFPFWNGFPLIPHLSHNDGKKLDLAFFYKDTLTGESLYGKSPSWIGYGICEVPKHNEVNTALLCQQKGYWQYSFLEKITPQGKKQTMLFDAKLTRKLIVLLAKSKLIEKIFIEPHLKQRLNLQAYNKIRFHGCQAVRHDDHIHIQL